jgi:hypothetical protein
MAYAPASSEPTGELQKLRDSKEIQALRASQLPALSSRISLIQEAAGDNEGRSQGRCTNCGTAKVLMVMKNKPSVEIEGKAIGQGFKHKTTAVAQADATF